MTIQTVFFIFGIILIVAAVGLGIAAAVYFQRMDIRSVQADLSGKARQAGIASINFSSAKTKNKKGALAKDFVWQGGIAKGDLKKHQTVRSTTGSSEVTEAEASTSNEANGSSLAGRNAKVASSSDVSETQVSETRVASQEANGRATREEKVPETRAEVACVQAETKSEEIPETQVSEADDAAKAAPSRLFRIERSVIRLGSSTVLDEEGRLKEVDSAGRAVER